MPALRCVDFGSHPNSMGTHGHGGISPGVGVVADEIRPDNHHFTLGELLAVFLHFGDCVATVRCHVSKRAQLFGNDAELCGYRFRIKPWNSQYTRAHTYAHFGRQQRVHAGKAPVCIGAANNQLILGLCGAAFWRFDICSISNADHNGLRAGLV